MHIILAILLILPPFGYISHPLIFYQNYKQDHNQSYTITQWLNLKHRTITVKSDVQLNQDSVIQALNAELNQDYTNAETLYQTVLNNDPKNKTALAGLIRVKLKIRPEENRLTERLIKKYYNLYGTDNNYLLLQALTIKISNPQKALEIINSLLAKDPTNDRLLDVKDMILTHLTKNPTAVFQYDLVIYQPYLYHAQLASEIDDYALMEKLYYQYLMLNPKDKNTLLRLINVQTIMNNVIAAQANLQFYYAQYGIDNGYLIEKARYLAMTADIASSLAIVNALLIKEPINPDILELRKYILKSKKSS